MGKITFYIPFDSIIDAILYPSVFGRYVTRTGDFTRLTLHDLGD